MLCPNYPFCVSAAGDYLGSDYTYVHRVGFALKSCQLLLLSRSGDFLLLKSPEFCYSTTESRASWINSTPIFWDIPTFYYLYIYLWVFPWDNAIQIRVSPFLFRFLPIWQIFI